MRGVADQLAAEGYIAVAPDLLSGKGPNGGGTDSLGDQVGPTIRKLTPEEVNQRLDARDWALAQPSANGKTGSVGFCWGGGAEQLCDASAQAQRGSGLLRRAPKKDLDKIECPVLGCYGGNDNRITSTVEATKKSMEEAKKSYDPHVRRARHGFLRQHRARTGANQKAAEGAWGDDCVFKKNLRTVEQRTQELRALVLRGVALGAGSCTAPILVGPSPPRKFHPLLRRPLSGKRRDLRRSSASA